MDHTSSSQTAQREAAKAESRVSGQADESDAFPPRRISTLPPLDNHEAQESFLRSPSAVLESIGLRVPAALAAHIRRSSVPPPPATPSVSQAAEPSAAQASEPSAVSAPATATAEAVEPSSTPTSLPPARRGKGRASAKKKKT